MCKILQSRKSILHPKSQNLVNSVLDILFKNTNNDEVICSFDNSVVVKLNKKYVQFDLINLPNIRVGDRFFNFTLKDNLEI